MSVPLVSIIVRSMDRPTLSDALDSIAGQSYGNVEIVVVAAAGAGHRALAPEYRGRSLVMVPAPGPLRRSAAANAGLLAARGELLGFLDDDDILLPGHIEALAGLLAAHPGAVAAYGRVQAVDGAGRLLREFGLPYDPVALQLENRLPIHSVLFRRSVVEAGARFDPQLDLCEDWDFWRQVALEGDFLFHDEITAIYRIAGGSGFALTGDPQAARAAEIAVTKKWMGRLHEALAYELVVRARAFPALQELQAKADLSEFHLTDLRRMHADLERQHRELSSRHEQLDFEQAKLSARHMQLMMEHDQLRMEHDAFVEQANAERERLEGRLASTIALYENSRSWRVTRPLRRAAELARVGRRAVRGFAALGWEMRLKVLAWLLQGEIASARRQLALASQFVGAVEAPISALAAAPETWAEMPTWEPLPAPVDILIPVYNGFEHLAPLFDSLERASSTPFRLLICDDASTDERVWPLLQARARQFPGAVLARNSANLGFVGTVNRLFEQVEHHFVLLNTDVQVPRYWLERLLAPILTDPTVASVTPFTNAGTICSFPHLFQDCALPDGMDVDSVDAVFARLKGISPPELTTGVGFCMAVRLDTARRIGMFDPVFGKGYREENDWCRRAQLAGYRHVLAPNLFVHHKHAGSFPSAERQALADRNEAVLRQRYPDLFDYYVDFIQRDPLRPLREFLHLRVLSAEAGRPLFVMIDNVIEGGAQEYSRELVARKRTAGVPVLQLIDDFRTRELRVHWRHGDQELVLHYQDYREWGRVLAGMAIDELFLGNIYSFRRPVQLLGTLAGIAQTPGVALTVAIHDYFPLCPSLFLIDSEQRYCGLPPPDRCESCRTRLHTDFPTGVDTIVEWRAAWNAVLSHAARILVFSRTSAELVTRVYPACAPRIHVKPHSMERFQPRPVAVRLDQPLHIGVVGSIAWHKGWGVVKAMCEEIERRSLPYRITVIGSLIPGLSFPCLRVTGRYERENLTERLQLSGANIFFFASIWPETFSYVAHEIMACGVPFCCLDLGAPADSARNYAKGRVLPPSASAAELLSAMEEFRSSLLDPVEQTMAARG